MNARERLVTWLQRFLRKWFPDTHLQMFGSSCNGFAMRNSDVDVCLTSGNSHGREDPDRAQLFRKVVKKLRCAPNVTDVMPQPWGKVKLVSFIDTPSGLHCDLTFWNTLACYNTKLLQVYSEIDARVRVLGYTIKHFAKNICKDEGIAEAAKGGLASYGFILLALYYLQQCEPPVLPVLQELYPKGAEKPQKEVEGCNVWFFDKLDHLQAAWSGYGQNHQSADDLWHGMLEYYTNFDYQNRVVSIRQRAPLTKLEKGWVTKLLAIEDPFNLSRDIGRGLTPKKWTAILDAFSTGLKTFQRSVPAQLSRQAKETSRNQLLAPAAGYGLQPQEPLEVTSQRGRRRANRQHRVARRGVDDYQCPGTDCVSLDPCHINGPASCSQQPGAQDKVCSPLQAKQTCNHQPVTRTRLSNDHGYGAAKCTPPPECLGRASGSHNQRLVNNARDELQFQQPLQPISRSGRAWGNRQNQVSGREVDKCRRSDTDRVSVDQRHMNSHASCSKQPGAHDKACPSLQEKQSCNQQPVTCARPSSGHGAAKCTLGRASGSHNQMLVNNAGDELPFQQPLQQISRSGTRQANRQHHVASRGVDKCRRSGTDRVSVEQCRMNGRASCSELSGAQDILHPSLQEATASFQKQSCNQEPVTRARPSNDHSHCAAKCAPPPRASSSRNQRLVNSAGDELQFEQPLQQISRSGKGQATRPHHVASRGVDDYQRPGTDCVSVDRCHMNDRASSSKQPGGQDQVRPLLPEVTASPQNHLDLSLGAPMQSRGNAPLAAFQANALVAPHPNPRRRRARGRLQDQHRETCRAPSDHHAVP
ncbi:uncharacterized protein LOC144110980 [Amblyomma americanum]